MNPVMEFDCEKATQALNLLARLEGGNINKMKALKLIWLADRYHLRKYGRPIVNDIYFAMDYGPVPSSVKDIIEFSDFLSSRERKYASKYLKKLSKYRFASVKEPDQSVFSETDIEALEIVYKRFGNKFKVREQFKLAEYSHHYPEWFKHEESVKTSGRVSMNYLDFFENAKGVSERIFNDDAKSLKQARIEFEENVKIAEIWK